ADAFADTGKDGVAAVFRCNVVNEFLYKHRLADARAPEEPDLTALDERAEKVDGLDAGLEDFCFCGLFRECRSFLVDRKTLRVFCGRFLAINRIADNIEHATEGRFADWHRDRRAGVDDFRLASETGGVLHGDAASAIEPEMLRDFEHDLSALHRHFERVLD